MKSFYISIVALALSALPSLAQQRAEQLPNASALNKLNQSTIQMPFANKKAVVSPKAAQLAQFAKAPAKAPVYDQPEGTLYPDLYKKSNSWYPVGTSTVNATYSYGMVCDMVKDDNGNVYIKDPFSFIYTNSWIAGKVAENDTIVFEFPQDFVKWGRDTYQATRMVYLDLGDEGYTFVPDTEKSTLSFVQEGDSLRMVGGKSGYLILGLIDGDGAWAGYGEWDIRIFPSPEKPAPLPENLSWTPYLLSTQSNNPIQMNMAFTDQDEVYLKGFPYLPSEFYIKGQLDNGVASFPDKQYLGIDRDYNCHIYAETVNEELLGEGEEAVLHLSEANEPLTFSYNDDRSAFTNANKSLVLNQGYGNVKATQYFDKIELNKFIEVPATPSDPVIVMFQPYNKYSEFGVLSFLIYDISTDGQYLNHDKLFYNIFIDDETYSFMPDEYRFLSEEVIDMPYTYSDGYDIQAGDGSFMVYFFQEGFDKMGVQAIYRGGGEEHRSNIVYTGDTDGISSLGVAEKTIVSSAYYDLQGRRLARPAAGMYIQKTFFTDGTSRTVKRIGK